MNTKWEELDTLGTSPQNSKDGLFEEEGTSEVQSVWHLTRCTRRRLEDLVRARRTSELAAYRLLLRLNIWIHWLLLSLEQVSSFSRILVRVPMRCHLLLCQYRVPRFKVVLLPELHGLPRGPCGGLWASK